MPLILSPQLLSEKKLAERYLPYQRPVVPRVRGLYGAAALREQYHQLYALIADPVRPRAYERDAGQNTCTDVDHTFDFLRSNSVCSIDLR